MLFCGYTRVNNSCYNLIKLKKPFEYEFGKLRIININYNKSIVYE